MKQLNTLFLALLCLLVATAVQAQTRYVDAIFDRSEIVRQTDIPYGQNISVATMTNGDPDTIPLFLDVYTPPASDDETARPVVLLFHTGSFLPQYFSGQVTGGRQDSVIVEIATRLAQRGYVAVPATYRYGWDPLATDANVRRGTLLQATYRGIQDARTAVRFLRKTVAEQSNPYGIDETKIVAWGQGTGGYLSLGIGFLDSYDEISTLDKFINTSTALPYVTEAIDGDPYGEQPAFLNIPNHVGYSSDIAMAVNLGGALGDTTWIDDPAEATSPQPVVIGYHIVTDPFAPYTTGPVIVPTTNEFVVNVSGTYTATRRANLLGINSILDYVLDNPDPLTQVVNFYKNLTINLTPLGQGTTIIGEDHVYPFLPYNSSVGSGYWDWYGRPQMDLVVQFVNSAFGTDFNPDTLHANTLLTNPLMSKETAIPYIDTIMNYFYPRGCQGLQLPCAVVNTQDLVEPELVQLSAAPNPAVDQIFVSCREDKLMQQIEVYGYNGQLMRTFHNVNTNQFTLQRGNLPPGTYLIKAIFEEGIAVEKVIFR
ncbi:MAG: T9SS type A sorting domain-containing protein [Lewinella sp.]|nr:T9SS type A sorting domain-containing protein [Lewinella sp.]